MQVSVESVEGLEKRMTVELPADRVDQEVEKRLKTLAGQVRLDGFRPGKVPFKVVKQRFGAQARQEVYGELIQSSFYEAATQEKLQPAGEPAIELNDQGEGGFAYTATFEVMPSVELVDMAGAAVTKTTAEVGDADVDAMIEKLRKQRTVWDEVERAAQDGDKLDINFKGSIDGELFDGGSADNVPLVLGSGSMIDGFESGLLGANKGETRTVEVTFPESYHAENLAGKPASFEITVNSVSEPRMPEVDEDFVKAFGVEDGTEESLRKEIRENMNRELEQKVEQTMKEQVMDLLLEKNPIDVPRVMVTQEAERMKEQAKQDMAMRGQSSNLDLPASVFEGQAQRRVGLGLIIGEIIRANELTADEDKVRTTIAKLAASYEDPQQVVDYYMSNREHRSSIESLVLEEQVVSWVLERAKVDEKVVSFDELMNQTA